jgi:hypothetical protein
MCPKDFKKPSEILGMSKVGENRSTEASKSGASSTTSIAHLGPDLEIESLGNGYIKAEAIEPDRSIFYNPERTFEYFDDLTDDNIVTEAKKSTEILESYLGQHSLGGESIEEYMDELVVESSQLEDLESSFVMELDLFEYDGRQHVRYSEGEVAREAVEYLVEESEWGDSMYFLEDEEKLFIRSNP